MTNVEKWQYYLKDVSSPIRYITWSYYFIVSSCLSRRVWLAEGDAEFNIYPNLYMILVAPPGIGKTIPSSSAIEVLRSLTRKYIDAEGKPACKSIVRISPDTCTLESLYQHVSKSTEAFKDPETNKLQAHASLSVCVPNELGMLFKDNPKDVVRFLNTGYDCKSFERTTKHMGNDILQNMCLNFVGCCTVDDIAEFINGGIISTGFSSRAFFIYADQKREESVFIKQTDAQKQARKELCEHAMKLTSIIGRVSLAPEAFQLINDWNKLAVRSLRINNHPVLAEYYGRKKIHLLKMAVVCHFAEKTNMVIDADDMQKAFSELALIEQDMHKAFGVVSKNPIYDVAHEIIAHIKASPEHEITRVKLLMEVFNIGNQMEIQEAINFLSETQQIIFDSSKKVYKLGTLVSI